MRTSLLSLAFLAGCPALSEPELLSPDFEDDLDQVGACGDVVFFAHDAADEIMLGVRADGLVAEAMDAGEETTFTFTLPDAAIAVIVEQGQHVSDATCDDVIENDGPKIERTWTAIEGTATITIRPDTEPGGIGRGDLLLEDVVFEADTGEEVTVELFELLDQSVGWLPG